MTFCGPHGPVCSGGRPAGDSPIFSIFHAKQLSRANKVAIATPSKQIRAITKYMDIKTTFLEVYTKIYQVDFVPQKFIIRLLKTTILSAPHSSLLNRVRERYQILSCNWLDARCEIIRVTKTAFKISNECGTEFC